MRGSLCLGFLLALLLAAGAAWLAPAWLAGPLLERRARELGIELELDALRPTWPLGFRTASASLTTAQAAVQLSSLRAVWRGGPLRATALLGSGALELETPLQGDSGRLFAHDVPLEALELRHSGGITLRGRVTGVATWDHDVRFSAQVQGGDIRWLGGVLGAKTDHVSVLGSWLAEQGLTRIESFDATGPSFDLHGEGEVLRGGELALRIEVKRVEERLRRALQLFGVASPPSFPARYALVGPWHRARLELLP